MDDDYDDTEPRENSAVNSIVKYPYSEDNLVFHYMRHYYSAWRECDEEAECYLFNNVPKQLRNQIRTAVHDIINVPNHNK